MGLARTDAALVTSLFLGAMVLGRWLGSRLVRRWPTPPVLLGALGVCAAGFLIHWMSGAAWLSVAGLFVASLGVANLYPLTLALAVGTAPGQSDLASARASLASGTAIFSLPLLLGGLADRLGVGWAYGIVLLVMALAGLVMLAAQRCVGSAPAPV